MRISRDSTRPRIFSKNFDRLSTFTRPLDKKMSETIKTAQAPLASEMELAHIFEAQGTASFIKCIRDTRVEWNTDKSLILEAEAGMFEEGDSLTSLPRDKYEISPFEPVKLIARLKEPSYLLTLQKLHDILRHRYLLNVKLYSKWELNIWPLFLDCYLRTGRWPSTIDDMRDLGAVIVADARENGTPQLRTLSKLRRLRREFPIIVITRVNVHSTIRKWAKKHWAAIYRKFFNSPHFEEMEANAILLRSLREWGDGLIALRSVRKNDDLAFAMPFELARADSLRCDGVLGFSKESRVGPSPKQSKVVSSLHFESVAMGPIPLPCKVTFERVQVPMASGCKKIYGAVMTSPIIVKGQHVSAVLQQNLPELERRIKSGLFDLIRPKRTPRISENPADLKLDIHGAEA